MNKRFFPAVLLAALSLPASSQEGLTTLQSIHSVSATADRLESALEAQGFRIFARIDHAAGAAGADLELPQTQLLIFGNPRVGTQLMQASRTAGIDLPMKYLVWQTADGAVSISWNDAGWLADRHDIDADTPLLGKITKTLEKFAKEAAR